jgi:hypothetical protein
MAKPLVKHGQFELHKLKQKHIGPFVKNMSLENLREFHVLYEADPYEGLLSALEDDLCHAVLVGSDVAAICGVYDGVMWSLFSKDIKKHWRTFVRASPKLINFYHNFHDELQCQVWDENTFIHNWLVHLGFQPEFIATDDRGYTTVNFVRCNYWFDDVHSKASRPVMH